MEGLATTTAEDELTNTQENIIIIIADDKILLRYTQTSNIYLKWNKWLDIRHIPGK